jgi:hypothetical protein
MSYILPLAILALISFAITAAIYGSKFGKNSNLVALIAVSGICSALPWFALWVIAHLNQQHCPSQGPCKLDGMQMIGEVLALYAFPPAFLFGVLSALFLTFLKRR